MEIFDRVSSWSVQKLTRRNAAGIKMTSSFTNNDDRDENSKVDTADEPRSLSSKNGSSKIPKLFLSSAKNFTNEDWRRRENELNETFNRKLEILRQQMRMEKSKELDTLAANLRKKYEVELETTLRAKEKELKVMKLQWQKSQEQLVARSKSGPLANAISQDSIKSSKSQDHNRTRISIDTSNTRDQLAMLQQSVKRQESELKRKEAEIRTLKGQCDTEIQRMARDARRHIKALLEELQKKQRKIEKLESQPRSKESHKKDEHGRPAAEKLPSPKHQESTSNIVTTPTQQVANMNTKLAFSSSSSSISVSRLALTSSTVVSKDDYDKEKQRWQQKMNELEAALKRSEETSADLAQTKAELIRKNKEVEKAKKSLEDFNKKLGERQKSTNQEIRQLEQKLREAQEETIRATEACETVTLECNRLKEKRYNPDRDEELERMRQQNLEYCKCISALKQTILEKDRRLEILQQKTKRPRRQRQTLGGERSDDENVRSFNDLDSTATSLASLDTITEDYAEATKEELEISYRQLAKEHVELQNICTALLRQANSEGFNGCNQDLRDRLQEVLQKIIQLQRNGACMSTLGVDIAWAQEKLRYASLIRAMGEKIQLLEMAQERLQQELGSAKEENELLEFQVLEFEQSQSEDVSTSVSMVTSRCKSLCDRSVSTSEDEGHYSMDCSMDDMSTKEMTPEELKIRFTLLKHRKELRTDDRNVLAQVKELWENLQNEHAQCGQKFIEFEIRTRELESVLRAEIEALQREKLAISTKDEHDLKTYQPQVDMDATQSIFKLQQDNGKLKTELDNVRSAFIELRSTHAICVESEKKEKATADALRKQLDEIAVSRTTEADILEKAARNQLQTLTIMRTKIAELEREIDRLNQENQSLSAKLIDHCQTWTRGKSDIDIDELNRLRKMNSEYHDSVIEYKKLEGCWTKERQTIERKYMDVKSKFKEAMKLVKEYEQTISKYAEKLKEVTKDKEELRKIRTLQEQRIADLERQLDILNRNDRVSRDDFIACKEVEEQLKAMLKEKSQELEEKCVLERQLRDEKMKLQKQLQHAKSYGAQLEGQFEVQIQIVQALKTQVLDLQKTAQESESAFRSAKAAMLKRHLDASHRLLSVAFPMHNIGEDWTCCHSITTPVQSNYDQQLTTFEELSRRLWNMIAVVANSEHDDVNSEKCHAQLLDIKNSLATLMSDVKVSGQKLQLPLNTIATLCAVMVTFCERLGNMRGRMRNVGNDTAENNFNQCSLLSADCTLEVPSFLNDLAMRSFDNVTQEEVSVIINRLCRDIKFILENRSSDTEVINNFRSKLSEILTGNVPNDGDSGCRTISPQDLGSGTESELCDISPILLRKRNTNDSSSLSCHSTGSEDDSEIARTREEHQEIVKSTSDLAPPSNVRLAAKLHDGKYLIRWSPPETAVAIQGYKVYVRNEMRRYVPDSQSTNAVVDCNAADEWTFINVRSVFGNFVSSPAFIDLEQGKTLMQNSIVMDPSVNSNNEIEKCKSHDENDDEECSEV